MRGHPLIAICANTHYLRHERAVRGAMLQHLKRENEPDRVMERKYRLTYDPGQSVDLAHHRSVGENRR